jgi:hypothetical protein
MASFPPVVLVKYSSLPLPLLHEFGTGPPAA